MQKRPVVRIFSHVEEDLSGKKPTSGGSRETDVNDPTINPTGSSAAVIAVTAHTPVG
jgi:hypothetical protein